MAGGLDGYNSDPTAWLSNRFWTTQRDLSWLHVCQITVLSCGSTEVTYHIVISLMKLVVKHAPGPFLLGYSRCRTQRGGGGEGEAT